MQTDSNFVDNLLHGNTHDSDSDSAESELNCSAVVDDSYSDHSTGKKTPTLQSTFSNSAGTSVTGIDSAIQHQINVQILAQLSGINDRLNVIENKGSKKSSDPKKIQKPKLVCRLPRSHCHHPSAYIQLCQISIPSDKITLFKIK